ncbi:MAG: hypothetical protein EOO88_59090, partial [Pedobacter sp.]
MEIIKGNVMRSECQFSISVFDQKLHSVEKLTSLLHKSYKPLADMGMHFWAATQSTANDFLGRGWSFPPAFDIGLKEVVMTEKVVDIERSLHILL